MPSEHEALFHELVRLSQAARSTPIKQNNKMELTHKIEMKLDTLLDIAKAYLEETYKIKIEAARVIKNTGVSYGTPVNEEQKLGDFTAIFLRVEDVELNKKNIKTLSERKLDPEL